MRSYPMTLLSLSVAFATNSCQHPPPQWDGKIYKADHSSMSVKREQSHEEIYCNDPRFGEGLWMTRSDFENMIDTYKLRCVQWEEDE